MAKLDIFSKEFTRRAEAAWMEARATALSKGFSVFYFESDTGLEVMEQPNGRKFEIRFIARAPRGQNYEVIREISAHAA